MLSMTEGVSDHRYNALWDKHVTYPNKASIFVETNNNSNDTHHINRYEGKLVCDHTHHHNRIWN